MSVEGDILALEVCADIPSGQVGGKALGLGKLIKFGLPVPAGFVVTAGAYRRCVTGAGLTTRIAEILAAATEGKQAQAASEAIGRLFQDAVLTDDLAEEIARRYRILSDTDTDTDTDTADVAVAVRSSATAEDLADASFAGQQDTYLWIRGAENVTRHVVRCWASLFTPRAIQYRARLEIDPDELAMAVVVQRMVPAEAAGVMMTLEPVAGDRDTIYIEGTYGLGEGVVRGDVGVDRYWVAKSSGRLRRSVIERKTQAHRVDLERGVVALTEVDLRLRERSCLSDREVLAVAMLGRQVEQAFGAPMDIEWAIDDARTVALVQARPETVWSRRPAVATTSPPATTPSSAATLPMGPESWNPLHEGGPVDSHWTTTNVGEAMPGVLTPLSWSVWRPVGRALPELGYALGALSDAERRDQSRPHTQPMRIFFGRAAFQLEFFAMLGDRLPGTTGPEAAKSLLGRIPEGLRYHPTAKRYPCVAWRLPVTFAGVPRRVRAATTETDTWYRRSIDSIGDLDRSETVTLLTEAQDRLVQLVTLQTIAVVAGLQPVYDALEKLVAKAGIGDVATLSGASGAEMLGVVGDLWKVSRGRLELDDLVREHGFHGPMEGELSSRVWREDPSPLQRLVSEYARRDVSQDPLTRERARQAEAARLRPALLAALPTTQRPAARAILALAARRLPLRGVVKVSLLQAFDVARAGARRIGTELTCVGHFQDPDDVFYLTVDELTGPLPADTGELVRRRRERRDAYQRLEIPSDWAGTPKPTPPQPDLEGEPVAVLHGIGVSSGKAEGLVRVVTDPSQDIEPDTILVAPTTDPSWSSIMFVSKALVVDIGGALSHAAVVARELGVPCVVNTRTGTRTLRTGDRVRVDGQAGTVEILERATKTTTEEATGAGQ
jgi:rifampicin phosphotransferase